MVGGESETKSGGAAVHLLFAKSQNELKKTNRLIPIQEARSAETDGCRKTNTHVQMYHKFKIFQNI